MSDLRTRISDVLFYKFGVDHDQSNLMADTLIRELDLKQERQQGPYNFMYRYATGFMTDE